MHIEGLVPARRPALPPVRLAIWLLCGLAIGFATAGSARADEVKCSGTLPQQAIRLGGGNEVGQQPDLVVSGTCTANAAGTYNYGQVNIIGGGRLVFEEPATPNTKVEFWASSIIVEANGALTVGSLTKPYGQDGGFLTIYLYGEDLSKGQDPAKNQGLGVLCKTPTTNMGKTVLGPCGIPLGVWTDNNGKSLIPGCGSTVPGPDSKCIPGLAPSAKDYFYQYGPLYGDGLCTNGSVFAVKGGAAECGDVSADGRVGYFGYKTLAVSYDGTLQMFGWKGTDFDPKVDADPTNSGVSWVRLSGDLAADKTTLTLDRSVQEAGKPATNRWWRAGEPIPSEIVVTTTDYLPTHSELATITGISGQTVTFTPTTQWFHRGTRYLLADRLKDVRDRLVNPPVTGAGTGMDPKLIDDGVETRAAVALLTRSVRIVSAGNTIGQTFAQAGMVQANCQRGAKPPNCYSFGGHTIFRQGFRQVRIRGVEFDNLGQGGKIAHYPIHFHKTRLAPNGTFVKDSSVNGSMTRWYVIHSTQNVTLARNIGYKSIGHGYYLEDGTETDNNFYSDIGILALAAIDNTQNPRKVPGILADNTDPAKYPAPNVMTPGFPYRSDNEYPTVFWITNGWNDFEGNMAAGAEACGSAYWFAPTENSDAPDVATTDNVANGIHMKWDYDGTHFGYAGLQRNATFAGATPLEKFYKNYATAAMMAFQTTPDSPDCFGFIAAETTLPPNFPTVREIKSFAPAPVRKPIPDKTGLTEPDLAHDPYYPHNFGAKLATQCPAAIGIIGRPPVHNCNDVHVCADGTTTPSNEAACAVVVLDHFTSAFNWAAGAVSAVWLRPQWYLLDNSVLSDTQNGAVTFVTGGDFTHSSIIQGNWQLALDTIFIGHTQALDATHKFSLDTGPFNNLSGVKCDPQQDGQGVPVYCLNSESGISMPVSGFFSNERLMNIYDGPAYEDSAVYLDVRG
jgi:hypothetical protein